MSAPLLSCIFTHSVCIFFILQDLTIYVQRHIHDITTFISSDELAAIEMCFDLLSPQDVRQLYSIVTTISLDGHCSLDGTDKGLLHSIRALAGVMQVNVTFH